MSVPKEFLVLGGVILFMATFLHILATGSNAMMEGRLTAKVCKPSNTLETCLKICAVFDGRRGSACVSELAK